MLYDEWPTTTPHPLELCWLWRCNVALHQSLIMTRSHHHQWLSSSTGLVWAPIMAASGSYSGQNPACVQFWTAPTHPAAGTRLSSELSGRKLWRQMSPMCTHPPVLLFTLEDMSASHCSHDALVNTHLKGVWISSQSQLARETPNQCKKRLSEFFKHQFAE